MIRCRLIHEQIAKRKLCDNAAVAGNQLKAHLRARGLRVWGVGLCLWYDPASGVLVNACTQHERILPPLSFGEDRFDIGRVEVNAMLHSHLPALFASALNAATDRPASPVRPRVSMRCRGGHVVTSKGALTATVAVEPHSMYTSSV